MSESLQALHPVPAEGPAEVQVTDMRAGMQGQVEIVPVDTFNTEGSEGSAGKHDALLEVDHIDSLVEKGYELQDLQKLDQALEHGILISGFQEVVTHFGAEKVLKAVADNDAVDPKGLLTIPGLIKQLAPSPEDQSVLFAEIKNKPFEEITDEFNDTFGGISHENRGGSSISNQRNGRQFEVEAIEQGVKKRKNTPEGVTDGNMELLPLVSDFIKERPEAAERFSESNDVFALLKEVREVYAAESFNFVPDLDAAKSIVEQEITQGEIVIAEVQELSDDIQASEIVALEERLQAVGDSERARTLIEDMLDKKHAEVLTLREDLTAEKNAIRAEVIAQRKAEKLFSVSVAEPVKTTQLK